jgi:hypothetical protein
VHADVVLVADRHDPVVPLCRAQFEAQLLQMGVELAVDLTIVAEHNDVLVLPANIP